MSMQEWHQHVARWRECQKCPLGHQRKHICLGRGVTPADVIFVGEAPGQSEDDLGLPFKGPAGQLLDKIIARALPADCRYALTNLVACFPRYAKMEGINEPERDEIAACRPRLVEFVRLCRPRLIVCVGALARRNIFGAAMFRLDDEAAQPEWIPDGKYLEFTDIIHPAAILKSDMPLAKKNGAANHAAVVVRNAYERAMHGDSANLVNFTNEEHNAGVTSTPGTASSIRQDAFEWWGRHGQPEDDIPF